MATGDLKGNLRKIEQGLRLLNYPRDVDYTGLAKGDPSVFLPIISYCFTSFSTCITELLVESDVELTAKNDLRFIEAVYKVLRDQFQYKPVLSKQQFLRYGFAERKIEVVCDIISLIYKRHKELSNMNKVKSQARNRTNSDKPQLQANCSNHPDSAAVCTMDFQQTAVPLTQSFPNGVPRHISASPEVCRCVAYNLGNRPGVECSRSCRSLVSACVSEDIVRELLEEDKTEAVCVVDGLDTDADGFDTSGDGLDSICEWVVSLTKKPGVECSASLINACIPGNIVREVLEEEKTKAICVAYGLDGDAERLDSVFEQGVSLTKKPEIERSRNLISACIPGDTIREVLEEEKTEALCVSYGSDSGADKLENVCEQRRTLDCVQNVKDKSEMEKLKSQIAELEEKLNKLNCMEDKFQALEEKLQGKIIIDEKDWNNLLSRVLLLETQLLLHSKKVDLSADLNSLSEENISASNVTRISPDREKEDLPESLHQSSGYSSLLSAEPSPKATVVINNHDLSEVSKDTTIQRMERISKMIEETSELLKTSSNTS